MQQHTLPKVSPQAGVHTGEADGGGPRYGRPAQAVVDAPIMNALVAGLSGLASGPLDRFSSLPVRARALSAR